MTLKGHYALRLHSRRSLRLLIYCDRLCEEFGKINMLKYTSWLFSQQLLAVRFVLEQ